jgi:hypothetical protein
VRQRTRSLACESKKAHERIHHESTEITRHSRTRMFLTAYGALSPVNRAFLPPSPAQCANIVAGLMPASRHQDHTLSPSASHLVVCRRGHVHRIPCPTFRDDREAPLLSGRDARICSDDLPDGEREKFLPEGLDRNITEARSAQVICPSGRGGPPLGYVAHSACASSRILPSRSEEPLPASPVSFPMKSIQLPLALFEVTP